MMDVLTEALESLLVMERTLEQEVKRVDEDLAWERRRLCYLQVLEADVVVLHELERKVEQGRASINVFSALLQDVAQEKLVISKALKKQLELRRTEPLGSESQMEMRFDEDGFDPDPTQTNRCDDSKNKCENLCNCRNSLVQGEKAKSKLKPNCSPVSMVMRNLPGSTKSPRLQTKTRNSKRIREFRIRHLSQPSVQEERKDRFSQPVDAVQPSQGFRQDSLKKTFQCATGKRKLNLPTCSSKRKYLLGRSREAGRTGFRSAYLLRRLYAARLKKAKSMTMKRQRLPHCSPQSFQAQRPLGSGQTRALSIEDVCVFTLQDEPMAHDIHTRVSRPDSVTARCPFSGKLASLHDEMLTCEPR